MDQKTGKPRRKHRKTGAPKGGARPGAGRPEGTINALPYGAVAALETLRWRVPENVPDEVRAVADRAMARIIHVMEEKVWEKQGRAVLGAATYLREEICGPVPKKFEHTLNELTDEQLRTRLEELLTQAAESPPEPE